MNTQTAAMRLQTNTDLFNGISSKRMFGSGYNEKIWTLAPNQVPFLTLLNKFRRITAPIDFRWLEDRPSWLSDTSDTVKSGTITSITTASNVGATANLDFTTGTSAAAGQIWMVTDADDVNKFILFYLVSLASTTWTIRILNKPTFTPAALDVTTLTTIAYAEGSDYAAYSYEGFAWKWGSTQTFKESLFLSYESEDATDIVYEDPKFQKMRKMEILKKKIDNAITDGTGRYSASTDDPWGAPPSTNIADSGSLPVRLTASLDQCIRMCYAVNGGYQRVFNITGSSSTYIADVITNAETIFKYVDGDLWGVAGPSFLTWMQQMAMASPNTFNLTPSMTDFGLKINTFVTPHGNMNIAINKGMGNTVSRSNRCYLFDMNSVELVVNQEIFEKELPTTRSGKLMQWEGRYGLKVANAEKHALIQVA